MLNVIKWFSTKTEPNKEVKDKVGIRKFLSNPNKPINITLESKDEVCSLGSHEKRLILKAILDIYKIKAELKEPRKRVVKKPVKETTDVE